MPSRLFPPCPPTLDAAAYENIKHSVGVSNADKISYLHALGSCAADLDRARQAHKNLASSRKLHGPEMRNKLLPDEGLGVLIPETAFIKYNASLFGKNPASMQSMLDNAVKYYQKKKAGVCTTDTERCDAYAISSARIPARSDGIIWLFRNPKGVSRAFDGIIDKWLGHRLGLIIPKSGEDRLAFSFISARIDNPRRPTFYDVEWNYLSLWHYGGATKPLPGTPKGLSHLEEIVSIPPEFRDADQPLERLRLQKP